MIGVDAALDLSQLEQEYLLHAMATALAVEHPRQLFLWSQGPLRALLPHQVMVTLAFGLDDNVLQVECQHSAVLEPELRRRLSDREHGLALRLVRHCGAALALPVMLDGAVATPAAAGQGAGQAARRALQAELAELGFANALVHGSGSGRLPGGASAVVLFGLPENGAEQARRYAAVLALLLPQLHWVLQRLLQQQAEARAVVLARPVSAREAEILHWVREGKSNDEIGLILGISGLTVKNHLQRLYRLLGVSNRTHAIARCAALRLFERPLAPLARAA
ncbi:MAG: LuxR C-terminal-related transcriptional regulator [Duganella sp.]